VRDGTCLAAASTGALNLRDATRARDSGRVRAVRAAVEDGGRARNRDVSVSDRAALHSILESG
jgi:hypothetical protein